MSALNPITRHRERCRETRERMSEYLDGEPDGRRANRRHLRWCPNCRRMMTNLSRTVAALRRLPARQPAD